MLVRLMPRADESCALRMQPQQENAYKHVTDALWTGMQTTLTGMGLYPVQDSIFAWINLSMMDRVRMAGLKKPGLGSSSVCY